VDGAPLGHAKGSSAGAAGLHAQECILRLTIHDSLARYARKRHWPGLV